MIIVLLGPPGAGKGTMAEGLVTAYAIPHISTGDMFRDQISRGPELGLRVKAITAAGQLVPDEITNAMVKERLARPDVAPGFILDGYPRTVPQAQYLDGLLRTLGRAVDRTVSYEVSEDVVVERISGRRSCPRCGAIYHLTRNPPLRPGLCDRDGVELVHRDDDSPTNVRVRLAEYESKTAPLKQYYRERGVLAEIDGAGMPAPVLAATRRVLDA
jgi:adenylate kinase